MNIRRLLREEFEQFNPQRVRIDGLPITEVEWFATDGDDVIGVIARDWMEGDWSIVILSRTEPSEFRALDADAGIKSLDVARRYLRIRMELALASCYEPHSRPVIQTC